MNISVFVEEASKISDLCRTNNEQSLAYVEKSKVIYNVTFFVESCTLNDIAKILPHGILILLFNVLSVSNMVSGIFLVLLQKTAENLYDADCFVSLPPKEWLRMVLVIISPKNMQHNIGRIPRN